MQDNNEAQHDRETSAYWALRIALGVVPIAAGLDKFTNLLVDWERYLSPLAVKVLPVGPAVFMRAAGVVEVAVGRAFSLGMPASSAGLPWHGSPPSHSTS